MRTALVRLAVAAALAAPAAAFAQPVAPVGPPTSGELRSFDGFLDRHPELDDQLMRNPRLADDPAWLAAHPSAGAYLARHPGVEGQLAAEPRYFDWRAERRLRAEPETRAQLAHFDTFLDGHPGVAREIEADPRLLDNPNYLAAHPELHQYLVQHPRFSGEALAKPYRTVNNADRYAYHEARLLRRPRPVRSRW